MSCIMTHPEQAGGELGEGLLADDGGDGLIHVEGQAHLARAKALWIQKSERIERGLEIIT